MAVLMNIIVNVTDLISGIYTNFHTCLCKKCDNISVVNRGIMKLMIAGYCLQFQFHYYAKFSTHAKIKYTLF